MVRSAKSSVLSLPGAPFTGGDGGDRPINIPGYMISQADCSLRLQIGAPGIVATIGSGTISSPLVGQMVGSSSLAARSTTISGIKPEIGAPGASVSAIVGTGTGEGPFGGTSGAAPMVSGAAALLLDAYGGTQATGNGTPPGQALGMASLRCGLRPLDEQR